MKTGNAGAVRTVGQMLGTFLAVIIGAGVFVMMMMPFVFPVVLVGAAVALWRASRPPARHVAKPAPARVAPQADAKVAIA